MTRGWMTKAGVICLLFAHAAGSGVFDVTSYGAKADNTTVNTDAFRAAAAAAAAAAPDATIAVSGTGTFLTGSFNLSSGVTLDIARGATVRGVGSDSDAQFPIVPPLPSYGINRDTHTGTNRHQALVMVPPGADSVRIIGGGTLHGGGAWWWEARSKNRLKAGRPHLVEIYNATNVELADVRLVDSGFWTLHPVYSRGVHIHDVSIEAPASSPNTDGIDPDSSTDVLIERCTISCGDDHIAIKSGIDAFGRAVGIPSRNITVRGNVHLAGRGISIGSEVSGGVEGVVIEDVQHLGPSEHGLHIKTSGSRGGYIRDVLYRNITIGDVVSDKVISLMTTYGYQSASPSSLRQSGPLVTPTDIRNVRYVSVSRGGAKIHDGGAGQWSCFKDAPCHNITLKDVNIDPAEGWSCSYVKSPDVGSFKAVDNVSPRGLSKCFGNK